MDKRTKKTVDNVLSEEGIRTALLSRLALTKVSVRSELGLISHTVRADVATLADDTLSLYEIKSERDTLKRLKNQVEVYSLVADRAIAVVAVNHRDHVKELLPNWWGLWVATDVEGNVVLTEETVGSLNPEVSGVSVARLLWSDEVIQELKLHGGMQGLWKKNHAQRCSVLSERLSLGEMQTTANQYLLARLKGQGGFG